MRFIFKGVVAATKNKKLPVIYVEKIDYSFEVYAEKPLQIGDEVEITVKYFGPHDLGSYGAWIND